MSKLPYALHDKWRSKVDDKKSQGKKATFNDLVQFVRREARKATDPSFGKDAMKSLLQQPTHRDSTSKQHSRGSFSANIDSFEHSDNASSFPTVSSTTVQHSDKPSAYALPCLHCKGAHALEACRIMAHLPFMERIDFLKKMGLCFGSLYYGHHRPTCRRKSTCRNCQCRHPTILHVDGPIPTRDYRGNSNTVTPTVASAYSDPPTCYDSNNLSQSSSECTMAIIPVKVRVKGSTTVISTYAFMDPGSNVSFCTVTLMYQLGLQGKQMSLTMDTMGNRHTFTTYQLHGIEVLDLDENNVIRLPDIYTKDRMPVSRVHIPTTADLQKWPHLADIYLPEFQVDVGLLIGNNVPDACAPLDVKLGPRGTPYASKSIIGWIPWNIFRDGSSNTNIVNRADVLAIEDMCDINDLNELYLKSVKLDYPEKTIDDTREYSREDRLFLQKMSSSQKVVEGNHYEYKLPVRDGFVLPRNRYLAIQRLASLRKRLLLNPILRQDYQHFIQNLLMDGHAEEVPETELNDIGNTWYLPHHGVYHPRKPSKIRVVFDCSSKCRGVSLNNILMTGPSLINSLLGVLLRFRQEPTAVVADIKKMFYQVKVAPQDRDLMRFFWWPNGDLDVQPHTYRMTVHLFGAASSPSVANFALHQTIEENRQMFSSTVCDSAVKCFYVDDFLCAVPTEHEAVNLARDISVLCSKGGFEIAKWMSNSHAVLQSIPADERATGFADLDLDTFPTERALGVSWDVENDLLCFTVHPKSATPTRRNILSILSSVFDPLGTAAPLILPGKLLLQELCHRGVDWDTELSNHDADKWIQIVQALPGLSEVSIPRCIKPPISTFGIITHVQLHHFCDASEKAYGTASYLRFLNDKGNIHCTLLFGKARVAPMKKVTIPRLVLTSATVAVKLNHILMKELQLHIDEIIYWTDSLSVIRYIHNQATRFHTFVANRLTIIHEGSAAQQWRYVKGSENPADFASRGIQIGW